MSLAEKLTDLATKERIHFGNPSLLSIDDMINLFDSKYVVPNHNLLEGSATLTATGSTAYGQNIPGSGNGVTINRNILDPFGNVTVDTLPWDELYPILNVSKGTYTFSANIKAVDNAKDTMIGFYVRTYPAQNEFFKDERHYDLSSYKRLSWTFNVDTDETIMMFVTNEHVSPIRVGSLKLEVGSQATPWCLAPSEINGEGEAV